ncbi:hypothetical protein AX14_011598 [Amanita brunnescens Koide BX004]|nr:hypothetical protein AX14_011598 [Amanita brunnescens Koide BX004]
MTPSRPLLSTATVATVGLLSKAFLKFGTASLTVNGLQTLLHALESQERNNQRGIVTVSNHISTLDDPATWGVLPPRCYFNSRLTRWTLGASDIMFTNPLFSAFFRLGQTIETFRGKGIYQPAVDTAIDMVNQGYWIHLYSEGKVCQPNTYARDSDGNATLSRFKWGIGRIVMEANIPPIIIPMWLTGFEKVMPEGRPFPYKYMPRFGTHISITFGDPLDTSDIQEALRMAHKIKSRPQAEDPVLKSESETELDNVRSDITEMIRTAVLVLGKKVSGPTLSKI